MLVCKKHNLNTVLIFGKRLHLERTVLRIMRAENVLLPALKWKGLRPVGSFNRAMRQNVETTTKRNLTVTLADSLITTPPPNPTTRAP